MEGQDSSTEICGPKTFRTSDRKHQTMPEALRTVRHGAGKPTGDLGYSTPGRPTQGATKSLRHWRHIWTERRWHQYPTSHN